MSEVKKSVSIPEKGVKSLKEIATQFEELDKQRELLGLAYGQRLKAIADMLEVDINEYDFDQEKNVFNPKPPKEEVFEPALEVVK